MNSKHEMGASQTPALYPHRTLDPVAAQDPESVLRWAGTWLNGEAAQHGETLRAAADIAAQRERDIADLFRRACDALELLEGIAADHPRTAKLRDAIKRVEG